MSLGDPPACQCSSANITAETNPCTLSSAESNLLLCYLAYWECALPMLRTILKCVSQSKRETESFRDFIDRVRASDATWTESTAETRLNKTQLKLLAESSCDGFDGPLIYDVIELLLDGNEELPFAYEWRDTNKNPNVFKDLLKKISELKQNLAIHGNNGKDGDETNTVYYCFNNTDSMESLLIDLLDTLKLRLSKESEMFTIIKEQVQKLKAKFDDIRKVPMETQRASFIVYDICDKREYWEFTHPKKCKAIYEEGPYLAIRPEIRRKVMLSPSNIRKISESETNEVVQFKQMLNHVDTDFILVKGPAGSGKSTIYESLSTESDSKDVYLPPIDGLKNYTDIIGINCHEEQNCTTLIELLKKHYPEEVRLDSDIYGALKCMKCLLVIDSYDECLESSKLLINNILNFMKSNTLDLKMIIFSRKKAAENLQIKVLFESIVSYISSIINLTKISEKLIALKLLNGKDFENIPTLSKAFEAFGGAFYNYLSSPILFTLCLQIYFDSPHVVDDWSSDIELFVAIFVLTIDKFTNKHKNTSFDSKISSRKLLSTVASVTSNYMKDEKKFCITEDEVAKYREKLAPECKKMVEDLEKIVICNQRQLEERYTRFLRHYLSGFSFQEFLIAWIITQDIKSFKEDFCLEDRLNALCTSSNGIQIEPCINVLRTWPIQYSNVIKYIIVLLNNEKLLARHWSTINKLLQEVKPTIEYCAEVVSASGNCEEVLELMMTSINISKTSRWFIKSSTLFLAALMMLKYVKELSSIDVLITEVFTAKHSKHLMDLLLEIKKFRGTKIRISFEHLHDNYLSNKPLLCYFKEIGIKLDCLKSCVFEKEEVSMLKEIMAKGSHLSLSAPDAEGHNWHLLPKGCKAMVYNFTVPFSKLTNSNLKRLPFFYNNKIRITLTVMNVPDSVNCAIHKLQCLVHFLDFVAPEDKMLYGLEVYGRDGLSIKTVRKLYVDLHCIGYRTDTEAGGLQYEPICSRKMLGYRFHLNDSIKRKNRSEAVVLSERYNNCRMTRSDDIVEQFMRFFISC